MAELPSSVAVVSALATTPVKGLRMQMREAVQLGRDGVSENRRFYLVNAKTRMVNGKQIRGLSAVVATLDDEHAELTLGFPDGSVVTGAIELGAWLDTRFFSHRLRAQIVEGPWSQAMSDYVGQELRLVQPERGGVDRGGDGAVSLIARASLARLERVAQSSVDARRFRMLIEIDGVEAHTEDQWVGGEVRIGAAVVAMRGHVGRCLVTSQDPDSGIPDMATLDLLRSYRGELATTEPLAFGIYGEVLEPGPIRIGDAVERSGSTWSTRSAPL